MTSIDSWDWRYRIGFDKALRMKIQKETAKILHSPSRTIMENLIDVFSNQLSVGQLISCYCDEAIDNQHFLEIANKLEPLHLPQILVKKYQSKIDHSNTLSDSERNSLHNIIKSASHAKYRNHHRDIFEPIFGVQLENILKKSTDEITPIFIDRSISGIELSEVVESIIRDIMNGAQPPLKNLTHIIPDFNITIKKDAGFAEYWPTSLSGKKNAELIIYDNNDQLGYANLKATICHELLGHGVFYALAEAMTPPFFDHGAVALIEGWATWVEWKTADIELAKQLKSARCNSLQIFDNKDSDQIQNHLSEAASKSGYSKEVATSSIEYYFQFPGYGLCYTLGALWFENFFIENNPEEFFDLIKDKPWGDHFSAW